MHPRCGEDREIAVVVVVRAHADLHRVLDVDEPLLDCLAEHRAVMRMVVDPRVGVRVEVHERKRSVTRVVCTQQRQAHVVVAADGQQARPGCGDARDVRLDGIHHRSPAAFGRHDVAPVGDGERVERIEVPGPHAAEREIGACRPHCTRPEPRAGPVGGSRVERHARHHHVDTLDVPRIAPATEARGAGVHQLGFTSEDLAREHAISVG